MDNGHTQKSGH
nr:unnamed protein product [Callosobruchus chinensis]